MRGNKPALTIRGVQVFMGALALTISSFRHLPLDDRDADWVLRTLDLNLREILVGTIPVDLQPADIATLRHLNGKLGYYVQLWDLRFHYQEDQYS